MDLNHYIIGEVQKPVFSFIKEYSDQIVVLILLPLTLAYLICALNLFQIDHALTFVDLLIFNSTYLIKVKVCSKHEREIMSASFNIWHMKKMAKDKTFSSNLIRYLREKYFKKVKISEKRMLDVLINSFNQTKTKPQTPLNLILYIVLNIVA